MARDDYLEVLLATTLWHRQVEQTKTVDDPKKRLGVKLVDARGKKTKGIPPVHLQQVPRLPSGAAPDDNAMVVSTSGVTSGETVTYIKKTTTHTP